MWQNAHDIYLESRVLSADPVELVRMLYEACISHVRDARRHLADGRIMERCRSISSASEILSELTASLDHERGGDISRRLASLYDYMQRKLSDANCRQDDAAAAEVLGLLTTLAEAWDSIREPAPPVEQAQSPWAQPVPAEAVPAYASHGWNF
jgi:flagellar protein FliS